MRKDSQTFGQYFSTKLSYENAKSLYMIKGLVHGFLTLSETATSVYLTTLVYTPESDLGIKWDSFGFDWWCKKPIVSIRDDGFVGVSSLSQVIL